MGGKAAGTGAAAQPQGLGYNGEMRVGKITIGTKDTKMVLRKENEGSEVEVPEAVLEGYLDERFFTKHDDGDGVKVGKKDA